MATTKKVIKPREGTEGLYRALYFNSKDAIMTIEPPEWRFTSGNPSAIKMFNTKDEKEFVSLSPWDFSPDLQPDGQISSEKAKKMIEKAMETGSNFFEWTHKKYKGKSFPATVLLSRVEVDGQNFLQATVRDITEEKKLADKLEESEKKFKSAFVNSTLGMALVSPTGKWLQVNRAISEMLGYSEKELLAMDFKDITYPEEVARDLGALKKMLAGESDNYQVEKRYIDKKGRTLWVSLHTTLIRNEKEEPLYFVTEIENIDQRKKNELELREGEEKFAAIFKNNPACITLNRLSDSIFIDANDAFLKVTGYDRDEVIGKTAVDLKLWADLSQREKMRKQMSENGKSDKIEANWRRKSGEIAVVTVETVVIDVNGEKHYLGLVNDITERKKAEETLREKTEELETINRMMTGRELKMIELKKEIQRLREKNEK